MEIKKVTHEAFRKYGKVLEGYDFSEMVEVMKNTPWPEGRIYVPSYDKLEACAVFKELTERMFGGMPIQAGHCSGNNNILNALEYHRSSEVNVAGHNGQILVLGKQEDIEPGFIYDTAKAEIFYLPEGMAIEMYATTLHFAPWTAEGEGFKSVVILPRGTNEPLEIVPEKIGEDALLKAKNKWLLAHPDAGMEGAHVGLKGENLKNK
jgi:hypothetical protein